MVTQNIIKLKDKFLDYQLFKDIKHHLKAGAIKNYVYKIKNRSSMIYPCFINLKFGIHNGKRYFVLKIHKNYVGHKFGEFSFTRRLGTHKKKSKPTAVKKKLKRISLYRKYFDNCTYTKAYINKKELYIDEA